jgi:tape measure domain-containing protein
MAAPAAAAIGGVAVRQEELGKASARTAALIKQTTAAIEAEKASAAKVAATGSTDGKRRLSDLRQEQEAIVQAKVALDAAKDRMSTARAEATRLGREMATTGGATAGLSAEFNLARIEADKATESYYAQAKALRTLTEAERARVARAQPTRPSADAHVQDFRSLPYRTVGQADSHIALFEKARLKELNEQIAAAQKEPPRSVKPSAQANASEDRRLEDYRRERAALADAKRGVLEARESMIASRDAATALGREIAVTGSTSELLAARFALAKVQAQKTAQAYIDQAKALRSLTDAENARLARINAPALRPQADAHVSDFREPRSRIVGQADSHVALFEQARLAETRKRIADLEKESVRKPEKTTTRAQEPERRTLADYRREQDQLAAAKRSLDETRAKMLSSRDAATALGREIATTGSTSELLADRFKLAKIEAGKATAAYYEQAKALRTLTEAEQARASVARQSADYARAQERASAVSRIGAPTRAAMGQLFADREAERAAAEQAQRDRITNMTRAMSSASSGVGPFPASMRFLSSSQPATDSVALGMSRAGADAARNAKLLADATKEVHLTHARASTAVGEMTSRLVGLATAYFGVHAAVNQLHEVIETIRTLDAAQTRLSVVFDGSTSKIMADMTFLKAEASRLGISFGVLSSQYGQFAIAAKEAGASGDEIRKIFLSFAEAGRVAKLSEAEMRRVFLALDQMMSKGKIQAEEITRQLAQVIPGAPRIFARALGMSSGEFQDALKTGSVEASIGNLLKVAAEMDRTYGSQVPAALKTTTTELDRFQNTMFRLREAFAEGGFSVGLRDLFKSLNQSWDTAQARQNISDLSVTIALLMKALPSLGTAFVQTGQDANRWLDNLGRPIGYLLSLIPGVKGVADAIQKTKQEIRDASEAPPQIAQHREVMEALQKAYEANGRSVEGLREKIGVSAEQASQSFENMFRVFQKHAIEFNQTQLVPFEKNIPNAGFSDAERGKLSALLADIREGRITVQQFGAALKEMAENSSTAGAHKALLGLVGVLPELQKHETDFANAAALAADKNESARQVAERYGVTISSILNPQEQDAEAKRAEEAAANSVKKAFEGLNEVIGASSAGHSAMAKASDAVRAALEAEGNAADEATKKLLRARAEQAALAAARKEAGVKVDEESLDQNVPTEAQFRAREIMDRAREQAKREKDASDEKEKADKEADERKNRQERFNRQFDKDIDQRQFRGGQKQELDDAEFRLKRAQKTGVGIDEAQASVNAIRRRQHIDKAIEDEVEKARAQNVTIDGDRLEKIRQIAAAEYDASHALDAQEQKKQRLQDAEQRLGDLVARRKAIEESIQFNREHPDKVGAATTPELQAELKGVTQDAKAAADEVERLAKGLGDQKALDNLRNTRNALVDTRNGFLDINMVATTFANGLTDGIGKAAEAIGGAIGHTKRWKDAWTEVRNAFLGFAADFLRQIGQMMIRRAIFGALGLEEGKGGSGGGSGGGGGGLMGALSPFFKTGSGGSESGLFSTGSATSNGGGILGGLVAGGSAKATSSEAASVAKQIGAQAQEGAREALAPTAPIPSDVGGFKPVQRGAHGQWLTKVYTADGKSALVNIEHAPKFQQMISDLEKRGYKISDVQGYNDRNIRGSSKLSNHALGNAIDINPARNPMGSKLITDLPPDVSEMARRNGLGWGGDWKTRKDAMHFEVSRRVSQQKRDAQVQQDAEKRVSDDATRRENTVDEVAKERAEAEQKALAERLIEQRKDLLDSQNIDHTPTGSIPEPKMPVDPTAGGDLGGLSSLLSQLTSLGSTGLRGLSGGGGIASTALSIAPKILKMLLGLLGGGGGGGLGGLFASIFHEGGSVGGAAPMRLVDPSIFINAVRMHSGAMVGGGLGAHEVPAILEKGEQVLSKEAVRQGVSNKAADAGVAARPSVKVVNTFDAGSFMSAGLDTAEGEEAFFNFVRNNSHTIKGMLR